ncbi:hypothetical protein D3C85_707080 [compost metagenome]
MIGVVQISQCSFKQTVAEAIALQGVEHKGLLIRQRHFGGLEEHLQALTEEMPHRVAQEILELPETQRLLLYVRIKNLDIRHLRRSMVQHLPFIGVAEQLIAFMEITGTERLQRMLLSDGFKQVFVGIAQSPATGKVVTQLADQDRCRALAVITNAAADPTDIELVSCRQQRLEQQVAIIFTSRSIAGAVVTAHEVEVQRRLRTRVVAIVHAKQAHELEGDRSHRHQGAEVHRTGEEALGQTPLIKTGKPRFTDDSKRQLILQAYRFTILEPGFAQLFQLSQQEVVVLVTGLEEQRHQCLQAQAPLLWRRRLREFLMGNFQRIQQRNQRADERSVETTDLIVRLDSGTSAGTADGITQQHASQAETPTVLLQRFR